MANSSELFLGSDHAGFQLKKQIKEMLQKEYSDLKVHDLGPENEDSSDYPIYAKKVGEKVVSSGGRGVLICGSGIGMCITANKVKGVRAAQVWNTTSARLSRMHNDANVICMGARLTGSEVALDSLRAWLSTKFEGGRHEKRVSMIEGGK